MDIKATTDYDEKILKDYIQFSLYRGKYFKAGPMIAWIVYPLASLVLAFILIQSFLWQADDLRLISFVTLIFVVFLGVTIIFLLPNFLYKNSRKLLGTVSTYHFYDAIFSVASENTQMEEKLEAKYSFLNRVYETNRYLYLYVNRTQAIIVDKDKMTGGAMETLRTTVSNQLPPKKYILCK